MVDRPCPTTISTHARQRLAQRNLSLADVDYVCAHGKRIRNGHAIFVCLTRRDIPDEHLQHARAIQLEGTVLVFDHLTGTSLVTAYRNRQRGIKDVKRKRKNFTPRRPRYVE